MSAVHASNVSCARSVPHWNRGIAPSVRAAFVPRHFREGLVDGLLHKRNQDNGRFVSAWPQGHLLRRESDRQIAAEADRQGDQSRPHQGTEGPSRGDQESDRPPRSSVPETRPAAEGREMSGNRRSDRGGGRTSRGGGG